MRAAAVIGHVIPLEANMKLWNVKLTINDGV